MNIDVLNFDTMTSEEFNSILGHAAGQCAVALHFRHSHQDQVEAAKWFLLAAEQGHEFCINEIAYCYRNGIGVKQSDEEADKWYKRLEEEKMTLAF